ncbi:MAG: hypothetical protein L6R42_005854, partial [Xanthoria sp. 1 TBL-2021]
KPSRFDEPSQAARKQRRLKDPYAVDTDSEDEGRPRTPKPQHQEESLIDFLNSTPPLSDPKPIIPSAFDDIPNPTTRSKNINKKANEMYNQRIARTAAASATPGIRSANQAPTSTPQQPSRSRHTNTAVPSAKPPQLPPLNSRDISPHLMRTYTPSSSAATPASNSNINGTTTTSTTTTTTASNPQRKAKPAGIARSDRDDNARGMSDLADFLRNSEPPTQVPREMTMARAESAEEKEVEGKGIWGRIKKRRGR